ncbi:hypothetical protein BP6252_08682 [Coleophoma cylindrospora]|uniref:Carboxylic ester hydrolase n=1 Tax=Coleophoma cylindrospora TaxID=1849047 RepID=A0A3D8R6I4_9HELO|nr:hypothetical protein BP6252_08682 [Coleophoma cylindrospora]
MRFIPSSALVAAANVAVCFASLPVVDLGYSVHQATFNQASKLYNFSNIKYANAPRFGAPTRVTAVNRTTSDGQSRGVCPTALPYWQTLLPAYLASLETVAQINSNFLEVFNGIEANSTSVAAKLVTEPIATQTEDCLLLDVVVPQTIMNKTLRGENATGEFTSQALLIARMIVLDVDHGVAPVMVWIVGGGFVIGDKNAAGDPTGLIQQSMSNNSDGVIYVTLNYRLGLFGFMSGPEYTAQGGVSNLGFRDQRFALEWIQENIHHFGGDRTQVTVFGESGGGSSIMHQITAYGSTSGAPFQRVISQSPAFQVMPQNSTQDSRFQKALQWATILSNGSAITTLDQLKALPFDVLNKVNQVTVGGSYWGAFTWGPAIDGTFIPDLPGVLLAEGKFDHSVQVMAAHNSDEAHLFASPLVTSQDEFTNYIKLLLPEASDDVITYVDTVLYPPNYNGSYSYTTQLGRTTAFINDSWFVCNTRYIDRAFNSTAHGYYFDVGLGWHGDDIPYTYFNGVTNSTTTSSSTNATIAIEMQRWFTTFAKTGNPNTDALLYIPVYGNNSQIMSLNIQAPMTDDASNDRCSWWQQALYR